LDQVDEGEHDGLFVGVLFFGFRSETILVCFLDDLFFSFGAGAACTAFRDGCSSRGRVCDYFPDVLTSSYWCSS